jgi:5-formyltetrahydrofolate cyclo-ligase
VITERAALRQQLRRARRLLSPHQQHYAAKAVAWRLGREPLIAPGARIGIYLALPEELNLDEFINLAWSRGCQLFVPHITHLRRRRMAFHPFNCASRLRTHRWGMPQLRDIRQPAINSLMLDAVLVPLVGFDDSGHRLGMGAGFYDRHFARLRGSRQWRRPRLIGVAYAAQQVSQLPAQAHDIGLDRIVTERAVIVAKAR